MFDFIITEMDLLTKMCLRFELEKHSGPKTPNILTSANLVFVQLIHFSSLIFSSEVFKLYRLKLETILPTKERCILPLYRLCSAGCSA